MVNKIEESYNKCLNLFKEGKRDTEEYRKELENVIELAKDNNELHFNIYKVVIDGKEHEFAAGEVSNNVWCFYLPKE